MAKMEKPPVDEPMMLSYGNFECMGYLDCEGVWHEWFSNKEIKNVTDWTLLY